MLTLVCFVLFLLSTNAALDFEATTYFKPKPHNWEDNFFGHCVALSGDGKTLAVAAPGDRNRNGGVNPQYEALGSRSMVGAVWVYVQKSNLSWAQEAYIKASNAEDSDNFGAPSFAFQDFWKVFSLYYGPRCSLSLSRNGSVLAVGAVGEDSAATGTGGNQSWNNASNSGAVYVFSRNQGNWKQDAYIKASNTGSGDFFGASLSLNDDGTQLVVGAPGEASVAVGTNGDQSDDSQQNIGAAYFFDNMDGSWTQRHYIKPPSLTFKFFSLQMNFTTFGRSVSLSGNGQRLAVGSDGAVCIFNRLLDGNWEAEPIVSVSSGWCDDFCGNGFGKAVALSRDASTLAVGAPTYYNMQPYDGYVEMTGIAYVFRRNGTSWKMEGSFVPTRGDVSQALGSSVWLSGDGSVLAVSAPYDCSSAVLLNGDETSTSLKDSGAAILYTRAPNGVWTKVLYVKAPVPGLQARFGYVVGNDDASIIAIGSPYEAGRSEGINGDMNSKSFVGDDGAAYTYQMSICPPGFSGTLRSGCVDVDECQINNGECDQLTQCINTEGSRVCGPCPPGYEPGSGDTPCMDLNECAVENGGCDALTTCTNLPGTYNCGSCPLGSNGNATSGCYITTSGFGSELGDTILPLVEKVVIVGDASVAVSQYLTVNSSLYIRSGSLNLFGVSSFGPDSFTRVDGNMYVTGTIFFHLGAIIEVAGSLEISPNATLSLVLDQDPGNVEIVNASVIRLVNNGTILINSKRSLRGDAVSSFINSECYVLGSSSVIVSSGVLKLARAVSNNCSAGACLISNGGCDENASCFFRDSQVICGSCPPGFTGTGDQTCHDVDECGLANGGCDILTTCLNIPGSKECGPCPNGFSGTGLLGCIDVNECASDNGGCDRLTACINLPGTHECGPCPDGYLGTGILGCTDVNECESGNGGCDELTNCTNTIGSYLCGPCPAGYIGSGFSGCTDINECLDQNGGCDPLVTCTNTPGSRICGLCPSGYTGTGLSGCIDLNECEKNNGGCLRLCVNTLGSFQCMPCPSGYKGSSVPGCYDINECASDNGGCAENCTNIPGSFMCAPCAPGYAGAGCPDINECAVMNGGCQQLCVNSPGSFSCRNCSYGFQWNGTSCADINECLQNNGSCDPKKNCTNTEGSFFCSSCPPGFSEDANFACVDINECSINNGNCDLLTTCINTIGSYSCSQCPTGYYPGTGKTPCMRVLPCYAGQNPVLVATSNPTFSPPRVSVGGAAESPVYSLSDTFESIDIHFANGTFRSYGFLPHGKQANRTSSLALDSSRNLLFILFSTNELCQVSVPSWSSSSCFNISGMIGQADMALDPSGQLIYILGSSNLASNGLIQVVNTTTGMIIQKGTNTSLTSYSKIEYDAARGRLLVLDSTNGMQLLDVGSLQKVSQLGNVSSISTVFDFAFASRAGIIFYASNSFVHAFFSQNHTYWSSFGGPGISVSRFGTASCVWISDENSTHVVVSVTSRVLYSLSDHHVIRTWAFDVLSGVATFTGFRGPQAKVELPLCASSVADSSTGSFWCASSAVGSFHEWKFNGTAITLLREFGVPKHATLNLSTINFPFVIDGYVFALGMAKSRIIVAGKSSFMFDKVNLNVPVATFVGPHYGVKVWNETTTLETVTFLSGPSAAIRRFDVLNPSSVVSRSIFAWPNRTEISIYTSQTSGAIDIRRENGETVMYISSDSGIFKFLYNISSSPLIILRRWAFTSCFASSLVAPPVSGSPVWYIDLCKKTVNILSDNGQLTQVASGFVVDSWSLKNNASPKLLYAENSMFLMLPGVIKIFDVNGTLIQIRGQRYGSLARNVPSGRIDPAAQLTSNLGPNFIMSVGRDVLYVSSNSDRIDRLSKLDLSPQGASFLQSATSYYTGRVIDEIYHVGPISSPDGSMKSQNLLARVNLTTMEVIDTIGDNSTFFGMTSSSNSINFFASAASSNGCMWVFAQNASSTFRVYRLSPDRSSSLGFVSFPSGYLPIVDSKEDPQGRFFYIVTGSIVWKVDVLTFNSTFFVPAVNKTKSFIPMGIDFDGAGNIVIGAGRDIFGVWIIAPNGTQLTFYDLGNSISRVSYARIDTFQKQDYSGIAIYAAYQHPTIFKYELVCSCAPGYAGPKCTDIDECATGIANCSGLATCVNTIGSYKCQCNPGFSGTGFSCTEIDDCSLGTHNCDKNAECSKIWGASFTCTCKDGFEGPGTNCTDIDECLQGTHNCPFHSICINTIGSFKCTCEAGEFQGSLCLIPIGKSCLSGADCFSGFCTDGVCCNSKCQGNSTACSTVRKGRGVDGFCECVGESGCVSSSSHVPWNQQAQVTAITEIQWVRPYAGAGGMANPVYTYTWNYLEVIGVLFQNGSFVSHGIFPGGEQANGTKSISLDSRNNILYILKSDKLCRVYVPEWISSECFQLDIGSTDITLDPTGAFAFILGCTKHSACVQVINLETKEIVRWGANIMLESSARIALDSNSQRLLILNNSRVTMFNSSTFELLQQTLPTVPDVGSIFEISFSESTQMIVISSNLAHIYFANLTYFTSFDAKGASLWISEENATHIHLTGIVADIFGNYDGLVRTWRLDVATGIVTLTSTVGSNPRSRMLPACRGGYQPKSLQSWWCSDSNYGLLQEYDMSSGFPILKSNYGITLSTNSPSPLSLTNIPLKIVGLPVSMDVGTTAISVVTYTNGLLLDRADPNTILSSFNFSSSFECVKLWTGPDGVERVTLLTGWDIVQFPVSNQSAHVTRGDARWIDGRLLRWYGAHNLHVRIENGVHFLYVVDRLGVLKFPFNISQEPFTIVRRWLWPSAAFYGNIILPDTEGYPIYFWLNGDKTLYRLNDNGNESQAMTLNPFVTVRDHDVKQFYISNVVCIDGILYLRVGPKYFKFSVNGTLLGFLGEIYPSIFIPSPGQLDKVGDVAPLVTEEHVFVIDGAKISQFSKNTMAAIRVIYSTDSGSPKSMSYLNGIMYVGSSDGALVIRNVTTAKEISRISGKSFCGVSATWNFVKALPSVDGSVWLVSEKTGSISNSSAIVSSVSMSLSSCSIEYNVFHLNSDFSKCLGLLQLTPGQWVTALRADAKEEFLYLSIGWQFGCSRAFDNEVRKYRISDHTIEAIYPVRINGTSPYISSLDIDNDGNIVLGVKIRAFGVIVMSPDGVVLATNELQTSLSRIGTVALDQFASSNKTVLFGTYRYPAIFRLELPNR